MHDHFFFRENVKQSYYKTAKEQISKKEDQQIKPEYIFVENNDADASEEANFRPIIQLHRSFFVSFLL